MSKSVILNTPAGATYANETEAWGVARVAAAMAREARARRLALAVLTPYGAHRDLLRDCLRRLQGQSVSHGYPTQHENSDTHTSKHDAFIKIQLKKIPTT